MRKKLSNEEIRRRLKLVQRGLSNLLPTEQKKLKENFDKVFEDTKPKSKES